MAPFNHKHGKRYRSSGLHLVPPLEAVQRPATWRRLLRALELEPEDLFAIPLCLIVGLGSFMYSLASCGLFSTMAGVQVAHGGANDLGTVVAWLSLPAAAVRQWFS
jgi:hypothetical protein